ncbi:ABC transporter permease [Streptomyces sp. A7024]|uniref:ABC transporter permease n=1 Tax=Streptomyces coryli TaxID=1128680 RepID=A0A6G4U383_9ACTN|nr:ABC transporter permease [Streptomyces coryli]NGN65691.1 ABC transporter permease [Streptomyces coryli]
MWRYTVRRILQMIPVLIGTTFIIYAMVFALPGDPIQALAGSKPLPQSVINALHERYNLDDPLVVQYAKYMANAFQGDFGETFYGQSVTSALESRWPVTLKLALVAWVFELVAGVTLGVWAGLRRGKFTDRVILGGTTLIIAVPTFVVAYSAQLLLGVKWDIFPVAGTQEGWVSYILPGIVLGSFSLAFVARLVRTSIAENLRADYMRTARAKGLPKHRVVVRHLLRNSLIPVVTYLGVDLGSLMSGALVVEAVFNMPGIGQGIFQAVQTKQGTLVVGVTTILVLIYLFANLIVDLLYGVLDPRIRYE